MPLTPLSLRRVSCHLFPFAFTHPFSQVRRGGGPGAVGVRGADVAAHQAEGRSRRQRELPSDIFVGEKVGHRRCVEKVAAAESVPAAAAAASLLAPYLGRVVEGSFLHGCAKCWMMPPVLLSFPRTQRGKPCFCGVGEEDALWVQQKYVREVFPKSFIASRLCVCMIVLLRRLGKRSICGSIYH